MNTNRILLIILLMIAVLHTVAISIIAIRLSEKQTQHVQAYVPIWKVAKE